MQHSTKPVVAIIEPDLIPLNREIVESAAKYVFENDTFLGCTQVSNHIHPATHIFASPAFFFITKNCYQKLGYPSFLETLQADVAENLTYQAEKLGIRFKTLYPLCFEREPLEGVWRLGSYGQYGIGTVFEGGVYHLFQSRLASNVELFVQRCDDVINNRFDDSNFIRSTQLHYTGKMAPTAMIYPWFCNNALFQRWYRSFKKRRG